MKKEKRVFNKKSFGILIGLFIFFLGGFNFISGDEIYIWGYVGNITVVDQNCTCEGTETTCVLENFTKENYHNYLGDYYVDAYANCDGVLAEVDAEFAFNVDGDENQEYCENAGLNWIEENSSCCGDDDLENYAGPTNGKSCDGTESCCDSSLNYSNQGQCSDTCASAFWADTEGTFIDQVNIKPGYTTILAMFRQSSLDDGTVASFEIYEIDLLGDDLIRTLTGTVENGDVNASWTITQEDLDATGETDYDDFYFKVSSRESNLLELLDTGSTDCESVSRCMHYTQEECEFDFCGVADDSVPGDITCGESYNDLTGCTEYQKCGCAWYDEESICVPTYEPKVSTCKYCGNGEIEIGETCDGTEWGPITGCSDFSNFSGGTLICGSDCRFNTTQCTGGTEGSCWDGNIDIGETCDGTEWGPITSCTNFDEFIGGTLSCDSCKFDTSLCQDADGTPETPIIVGKCLYKESSGDNCDDGFLTYSWEGIWSWDIENLFSNNPGGDDYVEEPAGQWRYNPIDSSGVRKSEGCADGSSTIPCPTQVSLDFFGPYSIIIIILLVTIIYIFLILREDL